MLDRDMPRQPTVPGGLAQFNIRMPDELIEALDEEVEEQKRLHPGRMITRSDLIREVLYAHVQARRDATKEPKR